MNFTDRNRGEPRYLEKQRRVWENMQFRKVAYQGLLLRVEPVYIFSLLINPKRLPPVCVRINYPSQANLTNKIITYTDHNFFTPHSYHSLIVWQRFCSFFKLGPYNKPLTTGCRIFLADGCSRSNRYLNWARSDSVVTPTLSHHSHLKE